MKAPDYIAAAYAAVPSGASLKQPYTAPIAPFVRHGLSYWGVEQQPEFTAQQVAEIEAVGGKVFESAEAFLAWRDGDDVSEPVSPGLV
jgi:hypothetical protein